VERVIGDQLQHDIPTEELVRELERTYDVYYILPKMTHHWGNPEVHRCWVELLGQNVLRLEDPAGVCEMIAGAIGVAEGVMDPDRVEEDLEAVGSGKRVAKAVGKALSFLTRGKNHAGAAANLSDSGTDSGLAGF
jgi:hypothetical protein